RVFDVDGGAVATAADGHTRVLDARTDLLPLGAREVQPEVVEAARRRIEFRPRCDEVQQIVPAGRLEKDHPLVRKRGLEAEDVDVEALGALEITRLEGEMTEPAAHATPTRPAPRP